MGKPLRTFVCGASLLMLGGCTMAGEPVDPDHAGSPAQAEALAIDWLTAVSGASPDRGWALLHPLTQERLYNNSPERYLAEVEPIDWSEFEWELARPAAWDGNYLVAISLDGSVSPARELADARLMQMVAGPEAAITVRIDFDGSRGILGP